MSTMAAARWDSSSKHACTHTHVLVARPPAPVGRRSVVPRWETACPPAPAGRRSVVPRWEKDFCDSQGVARPPPPPAGRRSVPRRWEMDFCESQGVPWEKVMGPDVGLNADAEGGVATWDDSGAVEALLAARRRYWAETKGGLWCRAVPPPPAPGPGLYCDVIIDDGGGQVDPELDAEYEEALRAMELAWEQNENVRVLTASELPHDFVPVATGWDDV